MASLMSLPRELRDLVYHYVVLNEQPILIKPVAGCKYLADPVGRSNIISTCKQLSAEYLEMLPKIVAQAGKSIELEAQVRNMDAGWLICNLKPITKAAGGHKLHVRLVIEADADGPRRAMGQPGYLAQCFDNMGTVATYDVVMRHYDPAWVKYLTEFGEHMEEYVLRFCRLSYRGSEKTIPVLEAVQKAVDCVVRQRRAQSL